MYFYVTYMILSLAKQWGDSKIITSSNWFIPKAIDSSMALSISFLLDTGVNPINPAVAFGSLIGAWSPPNPGIKNKSVSGDNSAIALDWDGFSNKPRLWAQRITELVSWYAPSAIVEKKLFKFEVFEY